MAKKHFLAPMSPVIKRQQEHGPAAKVVGPYLGQLVKVENSHEYENTSRNIFDNKDLLFEKRPLLFRV